MKESNAEADSKSKLVVKKRKTTRKKKAKKIGKPRGRNGGRKAIGNNTERSSRSLYCNKEEYRQLKIILELMHITSDLQENGEYGYDEKKWHRYIDFCISSVKKNTENDLDNNDINELKSGIIYLSLRIMTINRLFSDNTPIELYRAFMKSEKNTSEENKKD